MYIFARDSADFQNRINKVNLHQRLAIKRRLSLRRLLLVVFQLGRIIATALDHVLFDAFQVFVNLIILFYIYSVFRKIVFF